MNKIVKERIENIKERIEKDGTASDRMSELSTASSEDCFCDVDLAYGECPMCGTMVANSSSQKIS